jgi:prolipoprotein diacylglyceryltransferase
MLQSCARVTIGPWRWNSYFVCGVAGYLIGLSLAMWLSRRADLGPAARLVIAVAPAAVVLSALTMATRILGRERIVFFEKALAAGGATSMAAWLAGAPFLVALDIVTMGIGVFLAFGRIGCLRVGCCHGRPARRGIRYGHEHVIAGFDPRLRDVPLRPVQLADAAASVAVTIAGVGMILDGTPGHATALYAGGYGVARFGLELLRGDDRPCRLGLSEAQWIALVTSWLAVALWSGAIVLACACAITLGAAALLVARRAGWPIGFWLASPRHLRELDSLLRAGASSSRLARGCTTEGLRVSIHALPDDSFDVVASHARGCVSASVLRPVALQLGSSWRLVDAFDGQVPGLVHLLLRRATP